MAARSVSGGRPGGPLRQWRASTQRSPRETTTPLPHESRLVTATAAATVGAGRWVVLDGRCHTDGRDGGADRAGAASAHLQRHIRTVTGAALLTSRLWLLIRGCWCQTEGGAGKSGRRCRCRPLGCPRRSVPYRRARRRSRSRGRGERALAAAHSDSDWRGAPDKSAVAVDPRLLVPNRGGRRQEWPPLSVPTAAAQLYNRLSPLPYESRLVTATAAATE